MEGSNDSVGEEAKKKGKKVTMVESWLIKHSLLYAGATRHPFIRSIRDGSVDIKSLKLWLAQDYIFVRTFIPFVASVLVKASKWSENTTGTGTGTDNDVDLILEGLTLLRDEIAWFKKQAHDWNVSLADTVCHDTTLNYCRFMESLMGSKVEYPVAITALWAIESVYQNCFAHCFDEDSDSQISGDQLKQSFERWGRNNEFSKYCNSLRMVAERCLDQAENSIHSKAEVAFLDVLEHEVEFWNMSNEAAFCN